MPQKYTIIYFITINSLFFFLLNLFFFLEEITWVLESNILNFFRIQFNKFIVIGFLLKKHHRQSKGGHVNPKHDIEGKEVGGKQFRWFVIIKKWKSSFRKGKEENQKKINKKLVKWCTTFKNLSTWHATSFEICQFNMEVIFSWVN